MTNVGIDHVRTSEGEARFHIPIGSPIVARLDRHDFLVDPLMPRRGGWTTSTRAKTIAEMKKHGPDGKVLVDSLTQFQRTGSIARLRGAIAEYVNHGTHNDRARVIVGTLRGMDPDRVPSSLHRGVTLGGSAEQVARQFSDHPTFDLNLSSFSSDRRLAESFAQGRKGHTRVVMELVGEKRALPMENLAPGNVFAEEKEWATGGRFEVVDVQVGKIKLRNWVKRKWVDSGLRDDAVFVKVKQVRVL